MTPSPKFCLSDELRKSGQVDEAIEFAQAATERSPEVAWHHHHLADLLALKSRWRRALAEIDEAILLEPKRATHYRFRGEILLKMEKLEEARDALQSATQCKDAEPRDFELLSQTSGRLAGQEKRGVEVNSLQ